MNSIECCRIIRRAPQSLRRSHPTPLHRAAACAGTLASHLPARLLPRGAVPGLLSASAAPTLGVLILHAAGRKPLASALIRGQRGAWALIGQRRTNPGGSDTTCSGPGLRPCTLNLHCARPSHVSRWRAGTKLPRYGVPSCPPPPHFRSCVHALCLDARHGPVLNFWTTCIYSLDHARPSALFKLYQATPPTSPSVAELPAPADAAAPCAPGRCWRYQHETRPCTKLVGGVLVAGGWERTCPSRHSSLAGPRVAAARHSHPPFSPIPLHSPASACRRVLREGFAPCTRLLAVPV
jgi:hypothetical protein